MPNKNLKKYINQECEKIQFKNSKEEEKFKAELEETFLKYLDVSRTRALVIGDPESKKFKKQNKKFDKIRFKLYDLIGRLLPKDEKTGMQYFIGKGDASHLSKHDLLRLGFLKVPEPQTPNFIIRSMINKMIDLYVQDNKTDKKGNAACFPKFRINEGFALKEAREARSNNPRPMRKPFCKINNHTILTSIS